MASEGDCGTARCSLSKTLEVVGERWTFLVLREALADTTRFQDFRATLGIASDVLTARLATLVEGGVMVRQSYREPGQRTRQSYHLTESGRQLSLIVGALQQWGDEHLPGPTAPSVTPCTAAGRPVSVRFIDDRGEVLPEDEVRLARMS